MNSIVIFTLGKITVHLLYRMKVGHDYKTLSGACIRITLVYGLEGPDKMELVSKK